ncbi:hypothetical protein PBY51_001159 [Eleginops maclovinus]|uniref:Uncharacterized protein n=1 Tax=Eleginops maclovinus TaxID=56733 RepID=A0AAN7XPI6_ELEMC|nr:hypothetical protein PBY51_001159 [Eleginops maclovinus]
MFLQSGSSEDSQFCPETCLCCSRRKELFLRAQRDGNTEHGYLSERDESRPPTSASTGILRPRSRHRLLAAMDGVRLNRAVGLWVM